MKKEVQRYASDYTVRKKMKLITRYGEKNCLWYHCKNEIWIFRLKFHGSRASEKWIVSLFNEEHLSDRNYSSCYETKIPGS